VSGLRVKFNYATVLLNEVLREAQAKAMVGAGGIGLTEMLMRSLEQRGGNDG
jgi:hypothetical protein